MFLKLLLTVILLIALAWIAIGIKMFVKKNGQFSKSCSTVDPTTGKPMACTCSSSDKEPCHNE